MEHIFDNNSKTVGTILLIECTFEINCALLRIIRPPNSETEDLLKTSMSSCPDFQSSALISQFS